MPAQLPASGSGRTRQRARPDRATPDIGRGVRRRTRPPGLRPMGPVWPARARRSGGGHQEGRGLAMPSRGQSRPVADRPRAYVARPGGHGRSRPDQQPASMTRIPAAYRLCRLRRDVRQCQGHHQHSGFRGGPHPSSWQLGMGRSTLMGAAADPIHRAVVDGAGSGDTCTGPIHWAVAVAPSHGHARRATRAPWGRREHVHAQG